MKLGKTANIIELVGYTVCLLLIVYIPNIWTKLLVALFFIAFVSADIVISYKRGGKYKSSSLLLDLILIVVLLVIIFK